MTYPTFEQYIKEDGTFWYCYNCGRRYEDKTTDKMDRESLPCVCGGCQVDDLSREVPFLDGQAADGEIVTWDTLVLAIADSGMWRCGRCGFTACGEDWREITAGNESWTVCPRCESVEDQEVLKITNTNQGEKK